MCRLLDWPPASIAVVEQALNLNKSKPFMANSKVLIAGILCMAAGASPAMAFTSVQIPSQDGRFIYTINAVTDSFTDAYQVQNKDPNTGIFEDLPWWGSISETNYYAKSYVELSPVGMGTGNVPGVCTDCGPLFPYALDTQGGDIRHVARSWDPNLPNGGNYVGDDSTWEANRVFAVVERVEEIPSPLPLLGAAAAFGYSRKLRSRLAGQQSDNACV